MDKPPFADPDAMLLTAAIDFAVPPQANEQQIEDNFINLDYKRENKYHEKKH